MNRGPKPGSVRQGSLAAKLLNIRVGETIYLDDQFGPYDATNMERQVQAILHKSIALRDRRFTTSRWAAVRSSPAQAKDILAVTRHAPD